MSLAASHPSAAPAGTWRRPGRRGFFLAAVLLPGLLFAGGFVAFLLSLDLKEQPGDVRSDAVIVLTGGPERIGEAVEHLAEGRARRLLISGVNAGTAAWQIGEVVPAARPYLQCCIDLDRHAANTVGNAEEAARWMRARGYRSALVVTSNYHMPRAMLEFRRHMPDMRLTPAPVVTKHLKLKRLWLDPPLVRLLAIEYAKFVVAGLRAGLTPAPRMDDIAGLPDRRGS